MEPRILTDGNSVILTSDGSEEWLRTEHPVDLDNWR